MSGHEQSEDRKTEALARIRSAAVVPVLRMSSREHVICAIEGLLAAGLEIAEVTLTIPGAIELLKELRAAYGSRLLLGAGTVLEAESCRLAILAGADFIVSPVFEPDVLETAQRLGTLYVPGALTPTEIFHAWRAGAGLIKVFPVSSVGGPAYIRALKGPFPQLELVVTGGVSRENASDFIAAGVTAVGVGEQLFTREALMKDDRQTIANNASRFLEAIRPRRPAIETPGTNDII